MRAFVGLIPIRADTVITVRDSALITHMAPCWEPKHPNISSKVSARSQNSQIGTKQQLPLGTAGEILLQRGGDWSPKAIILLSKSGFQIQTFCPKT